MLTREQLSDLARLRLVAEPFAAEVSIIGAAALQCFTELPRYTNDIDLVVALDLERFSEFGDQLRNNGWTREERREHRWKGPNGSTIDIVPGGPHLRAAQGIVWPESEFVMSLIGFEHVFTRSVRVDLGADVLFNVAPPPVVALLKTVAYLDDPHRRRKDLDDLRFLFRRYEAASDRIFSDAVFAAELGDVGDASAFLLGADIGEFATVGEAETVQRFVDRLQLPLEELSDLDPNDFQQRDALRFQQQLQAFRKGMLHARAA